MKKGTFKYYLVTFAMVFVFMAVLMVVQHAKGAYLVSDSISVSGVWANEISIFLYKSNTYKLGLYLIDIAALIVFPVVFTTLFFLIDLATGKIANKKKKGQAQEQEKYEHFVDDIGATLNSTHKFNVEDFRHFRDNQKFQDCLKNLYKIYIEGESETNSYYLILRKFDKGTQEREAIEYLITFTEKKHKEKLENDAKAQTEADLKAQETENKDQKDKK